MHKPTRSASPAKPAGALRWRCDYEIGDIVERIFHCLAIDPAEEFRLAAIPQGIFAARGRCTIRKHGASRGRINLPLQIVSQLKQMPTIHSEVCHG